MLTELSVVSNQLLTIPDAFFKLVGLTYLDLSQNRIFELPFMIEMLSKLTILRINQNDLVELPEDVCRLAFLIELQAANNYIEELPLNVALMTNLTTLITYGNQSHKPPPEIMPLPLIKIQEFLALLLSAANLLPPHYSIGGKPISNNLGKLDLSGWSIVHLDRSLAGIYQVMCC